MTTEKLYQNSDAQRKFNKNANNGCDSKKNNIKFDKCFLIVIANLL